MSRVASSKNSPEPRESLFDRGHSSGRVVRGKRASVARNFSRAIGTKRDANRPAVTGNDFRE
ncbi:hypothetical protein FTUN_1938 [Frigoriglobus tundricola]|uniref:Uncharacterized protein n=1 Tax=Frigoriglobus tundricola TaxID=2774151 RepID=A0A6M5YKB9_9BACT|nr:hypothetical protein FTUN_1938 [Frigoriglobus tundricola]